MPPRERFPLDGDIWVPLRTSSLTPRMGVSPRLVRNVATIARVKPDATVSQVSDELHLIATRLASQYPDTDQNWDMRALTMRDAVAENYRTALILLLGAVNFVLLLACVSVSSLLVARNRARRRDVAIYETLGATRARLVRQFLSESVLLALVGGAFGLLLAYWGVQLLRIAAPASTPRLDEIALDWRVLAYTVVVSCASGILLGLAPAIQLTTPELSSAMRETAHAARVRSFPIPFRVRGLIIGCQIALAFPLVVGSMLALRSLDRLLQVDLGYQRDHVLTMYVKLSASRCPKFEACLAAIDEIVQRGRTLPGIDSFAVAGTRPLSQPLGMAITVEGETDSTQGNTAPTEYQIVTPEYFRTLSLPLRAGRLLNDHDIDDDAPVAVVNETLARRRFGGNPVGKRLKIAAMGADWITVVGAVADARNFSPAKEPMPALYVPLRQARLLPRVTVLARTSGNPLAVATAIQQQVWAVDKDAPITDVKTLDQVMTETVAEPRFQTWLLSVFAALGLTLALVGIYGLISYAVSGRFREFGVRLAIGAQPRDILWLVLSESLSAVGFGLVAGIAIALGLTQFLQSLLFAIAPTDVTTFAGVAVLIAAVAALAYYIPARRAARVDPVRVLRED